MTKYFLLAITIVLLSPNIHASYNEELVMAVKNTGVNDKVSIEKTIALSSLNDIKLSMVRIANNYSPILTSTDGKYLLGLSPFVLLSKEDTLRYKAFMQEIQTKNNPLAVSTLNALPKSVFLELESFSKDPKSTFYIISDPECPYCREELKNIEVKLATSNIKILFAPVHDKSSLIKSALIMKEAKDNTKNKLKVLNKYFSEEVALSAEDIDIDLSQIRKNISLFHESKAIKGVPFILEQPNE